MPMKIRERGDKGTAYVLQLTDRSKIGSGAKCSVSLMVTGPADIDQARKQIRSMLKNQ